jgi:hypothetical protein
MIPTFRFTAASIISPETDLGTRDTTHDVDNSPDEFKPNDLKLNKNSIHDEKTGFEIGHQDITLNQPVAPTTMTSSAEVDADLEPGTDTLDPMVNDRPEELHDLPMIYDPNVTNQLHNIVAKTTPIDRLRIHASLRRVKK